MRDRPAPTPDREAGARPVRAALMMGLASLLLGAAMLIAKTLGTGENALPAFQVTFGRYVFAALVLAGLAAALRPTFTRPALGLHLVRVSSGYGGATCMFAAAAFLPLADATALSYLNPMVAMALAVPILGERVGPVRWTAAAVALVGGLLLIRPGSAAFEPVALIGVAAACLFGLEVTMIKLLSGREKPFQILLMSNGIGSLFAIAGAWLVWVPPSPFQWLLLAGIGLAILSAQACYIQALKAGDASYVVPISYATLIFAALFDWAVYRVLPDGLSAAGSVLIIGSAIVLAWREVRARRRLDSADREH